MAKRSPILGYNHNFRHRGLVFHVQTEDSGIENPHIFTHLFHGGVILSSRKLTYDAGSAEEVVKALMQAQHKAMLKDLKRGTFDAKIDEYLGDRPGLEPRAAADTEVNLPRTSTLSAPHAREVELGLEDIEIVGSPADTLESGPPQPLEVFESEPIVIHAQEPESEPSGAIPQHPGIYAQHRTGSYERVDESGQAKSRTGTVRRVRAPASRPPPELSPPPVEVAAELEPTAPVAEPDVVVSRPSVIVGAPPKVVGAKPPPPRRPREGSASLFGKDLISEKSLDEVILAYLSEDGSGRDGSS